MNLNFRTKKFFMLFISLSILSLLYFILKDSIDNVDTLLTTGSVTDVSSLIKSWGIAAPLLSILLMIFQSLAFPIPAFLITGANGAIFGFFGGLVVSWIGAMLGAITSYYLARFLGESFVRKLGHNKGLWENIENISSTQGFKFILIGRLLPFISFDIVSYAAGLSSMKVFPFAIATGIGMLPGTIVYVLMGTGFTRFDFVSSKGKIILILIAVIALIIFFVLKKIKKRKENKFSHEH